MSLAAAAVLNGSALLLSCRTRSLHSMRPFARCFACTKDKVKGDGLLVGSASLRKVAKRTLLFPSASCGFVRASVNAAAADTSMDADAPITSSTPITDSAADGSLFPSYSSVSLATESDSVVDADLSSSSPPRSSNPMKDAADALDIRVGRIIKAWRHPDADSLYVEEVDVGEPEPRTICSGLAKYIHLDDLQDKKVVVLANLKPRNMRGVKSSGMLMAASDASHENVELLFPPKGSLPGERIWFGLETEGENQPAAATPNQVQKKKIWELVQPHLKTDNSCVATLGVHPMRTSAGVVVCRSLKNANIS